MIEKYKKEADTIFLDALTIDDENLRKEKLKLSYD